nr:SDR family oxidoreductase [Rhabdothermincola salaria]
MVTAGADGIGAAVVERLARDGLTVVAADIDDDGLARRWDGDAGVAARVHPRHLDATSADEAQRLVDDVVVELGGLDVLVNVVGGSRPGVTIDALDPEAWQRLVDLNLTSVYAMCRAAIPHMRAAGGGAIVNVSSGAAIRGMKANPGYIAAKAAVIALTRSLAIDHGPEGIRANCVAPGPVATPLMRRNRTPDEIDQIAATQTIVGRIGEPEELAAAIAWLASEDASYVLGQTLQVDGGVATSI